MANEEELNEVEQGSQQEDAEQSVGGFHPAGVFSGEPGGRQKPVGDQPDTAA